MTTKQLIPEEESDPKRFLLLQECEKKIQDACRRTIKEIRIIGEQLHIIDDQELWRDRGCTSMSDYIDSQLPFDQSTGSRMMLYSQIADIFDENQLALPASEKQALELGKLRDDEGNLHEKAVVQVWQRIQDKCEKRGEPVTVFAVKQAVLDYEERHPDPGVEVNLEDGQDTASSAAATAAATATPRIRLNERGELALDKITRLCGADVGQAIESGTVRISQPDLITWADQDDETIEHLVWYVIDNRWSVPKAIKYENRSVTGATTVDDFIQWCQSRGGHAKFDYNEFRFTVDRLP
jgi:hypothetical protein